MVPPKPKPAALPEFRNQVCPSSAQRSHRFRAGVSFLIEIAAELISDQPGPGCRTLGTKSRHIQSPGGAAVQRRADPVLWLVLSPWHFSPRRRRCLAAAERQRPSILNGAGSWPTRAATSPCEASVERGELVLDSSYCVHTHGCSLLLRLGFEPSRFQTGRRKHRSPSNPPEQRSSARCYSLNDNRHRSSKFSRSGRYGHVDRFADLAAEDGRRTA
jgi:hypothetical protein